MAAVLQPTGVPIHERYLSLDVLRGLTIALMIIVNTPGSWSHLYAPFAHAPWHGFTITDFVFPAFLFVVGNAMSFSMQKLGNASQSVFLKKVFKRTAIIFLIGWLLNAFPFFNFTETGGMQIINWGEVRLLGVLQRIALCYMMASLVIYYWGKRGAIIFSILTLLGFWAVMYYFGDPEDPYSMTGNAVIKLDLWLIGPNNMYGGEGIPFEPEGILSTFPAVVNVIAGYFAGNYIQQLGNHFKTVKGLFIAGIIMIIVSLIWHYGFPINKKLWTSSYVLLTSGLGCVLIGFLMLVIEIWRQRSWTYPFEVFGRNPLILYILSGVVITILFSIMIGGQTLKGIIYEMAFDSWLSPKNASLFFALFYTLLIWLIGLWMDRKRIYIKV